MGRLKEDEARGREALVWDLRIRQGKTYREIGEAVGMTEAGVRLALRRIYKRQVPPEEVDAVRAEHRAKLEHSAAEALAAWERSKGAKRRAIVRGKDANSNPTTTQIVEEQAGDPRFLSRYNEALLQIRTMLGANAPTKVAPTLPDGQPLPQPTPKDDDPQALADRIGRLLAISDARRTAAAGSRPAPAGEDAGPLGPDGLLPGGGP